MRTPTELNNKNDVRKKEKCYFFYLNVLINQCSIRVYFLIIKFGILVFSRIDDILTTLQGQLDAQLWPPVPALDHGLHLTGLDHAGPLSLQTLEGVLDVLVVDAPAAVVNEDRPEAEFIGVMRSGG